MEMIASLGEYNGITIGCRPSDEFVNATAMCQATGKLWGDWWRNRQTQEFVAALRRQLRCENSHIVSSVKGGQGEQGTWVHRRVAIALAQWCSPEFGVWVTGQVEAIMTGNRVAHREVAEHAIVNIQNDISVLHNKYESLVTRILDVQEQNQQLLSELLPMMKRVDERTQGKREGFSTDVQNRFVRCAERFYKGQCPCCQSVRIVDKGRRVAHVAQLDHYHHRSMNRLEHGWIVCKTCNNKLKNRKPNGFWFQAGPAFQQFQRLLHQEPNQLLLFSEAG
jgi:hypothetical protein